MISIRQALSLAVAGVLTLSACRKDPEPEPMPEPEPAVVTTPTTPSNADAEAAARDAAAREAAERERRIAEARASLLAPVYFEFDQSELSERARATLDAKVPILAANTDISIRITGHTDERGSDEYNLALGQRRAGSVRRYLEQFGISGNRIETTSAGEEQPAQMGSNEQAWQMNRRAEFDMLGGQIRVQQ
ncbi:MAG TPA: OmpA family protein [Gemmatimonadales bacterium]|nr:OmpA family protein [Gemmatimonadales bacterium]